MKKQILIADEEGFGRICAALLEQEGYGTDVVSDVHRLQAIENCGDFDLVITSYPYGKAFIERLIDTGVPVIILSDRMSRELMSMFGHFDQTQSHCMIKPVDYRSFRALVNRTMGRSGGRMDQ